MPIRKPSCSGISRTPGHVGLRAKSLRYFVWLHNRSEGLQIFGVLPGSSFFFAVHPLAPFTLGPRRRDSFQQQ